MAMRETGMMNVKLQRLEPGRKFLRTSENERGWGLVGGWSLKKFGSEIEAGFCGSQGMRGGVHGYAWRVRLVDGESARMEFGAVEAQNASKTVVEARRSPGSLRYTNLTVRDGDVVELILDLIQGYVLVVRNGELMDRVREDGIQQIPNHVLDKGYVTPFVLVREGYELVLESLDGNFRYDPEECADIISENRVRYGKLSTEVDSKVATAKTVHLVDKEVLQGRRNVEFETFVGDVIQFNGYENIPLEWSWDFEIVGDNNVLVMEERRNSGKDAQDIVSDWSYCGMTCKYNFYCLNEGTVSVYFGFTERRSMDRPLDNFIVVTVAAAPEEDEPSQSYCGIS